MRTIHSQCARWPLWLSLIGALAGCAGVLTSPPTPDGTPAVKVAAATPAPAPAAPAAPSAPIEPPLPLVVNPPPGNANRVWQPVTSLIPAAPLQPIAASAATSQAVAATQAPADLWDRMRRGFNMPPLQGDLVRQHEQWYATRPEYIQRMTERSRKYLFHIVEELERRNMPLELALLPYIESAFNPEAVSSARAAGIWQFMPATGSDYELKQNVFRDDRRDVLASTRAALDYLQKLHGMFGDWHLALAAYNWGQGSVSRAIARNQKAGQGTSYTELSMPAETRNYVPKLQAVKNIVARPEQYLKDELPLIENHPYFETVTITRDLDVALAARLADVKLEDFRALNPSMSRPVILAAGTPNILLPWDNANVFKRNLEAHNAGRTASWTAWTAPSTMSVAEAARRVGMSETEFRNLNTIPPRMMIRAGSVVLAPRGDKVQDDVASHVANNAQLSLAPEVSQRRTTLKAGKRDTVASVAARYQLSARQVAEWNQVAPGASFKTGQSVVVYLPVRSARATAAGAQASTQATPRRAAPRAKAKATAQRRR